jgi:hypothetical protein
MRTKTLQIEPPTENNERFRFRQTCFRVWAWLTKTSPTKTKTFCIRNGRRPDSTTVHSLYIYG